MSAARTAQCRFLPIFDSGTRQVRFPDTDSATYQFSALGADGRTIHVACCFDCDMSYRPLGPREEALRRALTGATHSFLALRKSMLMRVCQPAPVLR